MAQEEPDVWFVTRIHCQQWDQCVYLCVSLAVSQKLSEKHGFLDMISKTKFPF